MSLDIHILYFSQVQVESDYKCVFSVETLINSFFTTWEKSTFKHVEFILICEVKQNTRESCKQLVEVANTLQPILQKSPAT